MRYLVFLLFLPFFALGQITAVTNAVDYGSVAVQTTHVPTATNDLVNLQYLSDEVLTTTTGWANYADDYYLDPETFTAADGTTNEFPVNAGNTTDSQLPADVSAFFTPAQLFYDAETAAFTLGEILTGAGGATATITKILDGGTTGVLYLAGHDTSTPFVNDEIITDGSAGSATVNGVYQPGVITGRNGDGIAVMITFDATPASPNTYLDVWIDIGGAIGEIYRQTISLPKGAGTQHGVSVGFAGFTLGTWASNGGTVYVEPTGGNVAIDFPRIVVTRTHKAR